MQHYRYHAFRPVRPYSLLLGQWSENPGTPTGIQTPMLSFSQIIRLVFSKSMLELCWHYFIQHLVFLT